MIAVDTSALMAIAQDEPGANACVAVLAGEDRLLMSAGTMLEVLIVAARRNLGEEMRDLIEALGFEIITVTPASVRRAAEAYQRWGKGVHPAKLNFGDCFAYEVAREHDCPLLFVGDDFARTDVQAALPAAR